MEFCVKVAGLSAKVAFDHKWKDKVIPFRPKDIITITIDKLNRTFDLKNLKEQDVLMMVVPMHFETNLNFVHQRY